jgi:TonB family protein
MQRARALAAAHQLPAAAAELESIRAQAKDDVARNVSSLMLMGIYLEDGNYARAESMLEEAFTKRSSNTEASVRTYFALAGQAVNGARTHVGRYRSFGINVSGEELPGEAVKDLDRLRMLLERMSAQGKELIKENAKANDAFALLEEISGIRAAVARDADDRAKWQTEFSAARAKLATLPTDVVSGSGVTAMTQIPGESATRNAHPANSTGDIGAANQLGNQANNQPANEPAPSGGANSSTTVEPDNPPTITSKSSNGSGVLEVGSLTEKAIKKVTPVYPQLARSSGVSGLIRIKVIVDETGSVASIVWTEGPMPLRQATQDALKQWKFQPIMVDGKPVRATGYVDFGFTRN